MAVIAAGALLVIVAVTLVRGIPAADLGTDLRFYQRLASRFLEGHFYLPGQLQGPYDFKVQEDSLYPPPAAILFLPFLALPSILWWLIPIAITGYVIGVLRPTLGAYAAMLLLLAWPRALGAYLFGNSDIWMVAAVAGGIRWGWPAVLLAIKPTLAPLAVIGVGRRAWWIALAVFAAANLPMLPLWSQYVQAIGDTHVGLDYSIGSLPLMAIPFVAWAGGPYLRRRRAGVAS